MTEEKIRPFLIGIVDGGFTNEIIKQLEKHLEGYPICTISLDNYFKDLTEEIELKPEIIDFDLFLSDLMKIRNKEPCEVPIYDFKNHKRSNETKKIESCQIIIIEGLFCFYDHRIRNLIDLKIFIDTDNDMRLARTISKSILDGKTNLIDIIENFHKNIKQSYINFISPTKKFADIILPNSRGHETAVQTITNYLKLVSDQVANNNNKSGSIFSFLNEIIEPKYIFFKDKIIINNEKPVIYFLKNVFEDFITNSHDEEFIDKIRKSLLDLLLSLLVENLRKNSRFPEILPEIDRIVFDSDDVEKIDFENCNIVLFFKTSILNENDIKVPQYIFSKNKDCHIFIISIILSPKFAYYLTNDKLNSIIFVTLYFNEFFIKYENLIKNDETIFNEKELETMFVKLAKKDLNYSD